jgi:alpha-beta hydrolase superfamily lysophospholipase
MDHRGQGASGRMTVDPQMGYVEYFKDYVTDVETFIKTVVHPEQHRNLYMLAHSMGGGIAAQVIFDNPGLFRAVTLSSPMLGINTGAFPESVAQEISDTDCEASSGMSFAIGQTDFDPNAQFTDASNDVTRSQARFDVKMQMYRDNPTLQLGHAYAAVPGRQRRHRHAAGREPVLQRRGRMPDQSLCGLLPRGAQRARLDPKRRAGQDGPLLQLFRGVVT